LTNELFIKEQTTKEEKMKIRTKTIWTIVLTAVLFLSLATLGVTSVYRIDTVTLNASVVSEEANAEAVLLQSKLEEVYDKKSSFSVDETEAEELLAEFPHFRLTGFEKAYPNRIIISITEDAEVYAVSAGGDAYYILSEDGMVLGLRDSYTNRLDNADNVLLKGLQVIGEKGAYLSGDECLASLLTFCRKASDTLSGIRRNVVSVEVVRNTSVLEEARFKVTMREGVKIYIGNPMRLTEEKARQAMEKYLSLSDEERLVGRIAVSDKDGEVIVSYSQKDDFSF
jgi:hypothetical protein